MIRKRTTQPDVIEAEPDVGQAAGPETVPADLEAAAALHQRAAAEYRTHAVQSRNQEKEREARAHEEAERMIAAAKSDMDAVTIATAEDDRHAADLEERARLLRQAKELQVKAGDTEHLAGELARQAAGCRAQLADVDSRLAELSEERARIEAEYAAATASGDLEAMAVARNGIVSAGERAAYITGPRAGLVSRIDGIGDRDGSGELADVAAQAVALRGELWQVLGTLLQDDDLTAGAHAAVLRASDEEAARCAATLAAERERVAVLASELPGLLPPLIEEREELDRRDAIPVGLRSIASSLALRERSEDLDRYMAAVHGAVTGAQSCLERLAAAGPADLADVLAAARRTRQQIRHVLDTRRPALDEDDLSGPLDVLREVARSLAAEVQQPEPVKQRRTIVHGR